MAKWGFEFSFHTFENRKFPSTGGHTFANLLMRYLAELLFWLALWHFCQLWKMFWILNLTWIHFSTNLLGWFVNSQFNKVWHLRWHFSYKRLRIHQLVNCLYSCSYFEREQKEFVQQLCFLFSHSIWSLKKLNWANIKYVTNKTGIQKNITHERTT